MSIVFGHLMKTSQDKRNPSGELFDFMCQAHEVALGLIPRLKFNKIHPWHRNLVLLYLTMLELTGAVCILIREKIGIAVPILLRSLVEADLDFINLAKNRRYGYHMRASELKEWIKILKGAKGGRNNFLKDISHVAGLDATLENWETELNHLKGKGYKPLSPAEKFVKAGLNAVYESVYNDLCCDSHNNIRALTSHHLNILPGKTDFQVEVYAPINYDALLPYIDTFCGILVSGTEEIHKILQSKPCYEIEKLKEELHRLRQAILTEQTDPADKQ